MDARGSSLEIIMVFRQSLRRGTCPKGNVAATWCVTHMPSSKQRVTGIFSDHLAVKNWSRTYRGTGRIQPHESPLECCGWHAFWGCSMAFTMSIWSRRVQRTYRGILELELGLWSTALS